MKSLLSLLFILFALNGAAQDGWKLMQKADRLLANGQLRRVPSLLKKSVKANYGFCGNAWAGARLNRELLWAKYYTLKGDTTEALTHLLPHVYNSAFSSNHDVVDFTVDLLSEKYGDAFLQHLYSVALMGVSPYLENDLVVPNRYVVHFLDHDIDFFNWWLQPANSLEEVRTSLGNMYFSTRIMTL